MKNQKVVFDGFNKIIEFEAEMKGKTVKRELLVAKSAVAGIVIDENNRIGLVSQYRPVVQLHTKEIPAGVLDKESLTPVETLVEELMEECMIPKSEILSINETDIPPFYMMIGNTDAKISIHLIRVKAQTDKVVDDNDVDKVEWLTLDEIQGFMNSGEICDNKTIMAYYYLRSKQF